MRFDSIQYLCSLERHVLICCLITLCSLKLSTCFGQPCALPFLINPATFLPVCGATL